MFQDWNKTQQKKNELEHNLEMEKLRYAERMDKRHGYLMWVALAVLTGLAYLDKLDGTSAVLLTLIFVPEAMDYFRNMISDSHKKNRD